MSQCAYSGGKIILCSLDVANIKGIISIRTVTTTNILSESFESFVIFESLRTHSESLNSLNSSNHWMCLANTYILYWRMPDDLWLWYIYYNIDCCILLAMKCERVCQTYAPRYNSNQLWVKELICSLLSKNSVNRWCTQTLYVIMEKKMK